MIITSSIEPAINQAVIDDESHTITELLQTYFWTMG
jgi:hypothetical protein